MLWTSESQVAALQTPDVVAVEGLRLSPGVWVVVQAGGEVLRAFTSGEGIVDTIVRASSFSVALRGAPGE